MNTSSNSPEHYIVAIGASAGGLEAIHEFFDSMPDTPDLSFILIQHLSPDYKSLLVELVARHTHMKVYEATDHQPIEEKCIYVIPNTKLITIHRNELKLSEKTNGKIPNNAIDIFFYSLAKERKEKAIAIILSGTGTDGTKGAEAIKKEGGFVIVQDPGTAKFDGMPNSVIASGHADFILPPAAICDEILNHIAPPSSFLYGNEKKDEQFLQSVFNLIKMESGLDFNLYKTPTILRRINRRMIQGNFPTPDKYQDFLETHKEEVKQLGQDFLINVTRFFRDPEAFEILREKVLTDIVEGKDDGEMVKIWVTACSTGEEAYSIAILLNEVIESSGKDLIIKIFATDIDDDAIHFASAGEYPASIAGDIDRQLLKKYFTASEKKYTILPRIRKQIVFAKHNIIKDPPFIKNDLVTCRNMLIYISPTLQQQIFNVLLFAAGKEGFLFFGPTENSAFIRDTVEISSRWKIYKKITETKPGYPYQLNSQDTLYNRMNGRSGKTGRTRDDRSQSALWDDFKDIFTEELHYVVLYIDQNFEIKETIGNYECFLDLPRKQLRLNFLQMIPPGLSLRLSAEIRRAERSGEKLHLRSVQYKKGQENLNLEIFIRPGGKQAAGPYTMVLLREASPPEVFVESTPEENIKPDDYLHALETELNATKQHLQLAIEDLETTNEELQSTNEELLSANEELQSSNEELQSLNEELITLNTEHQLKIKELLELNDDLNNYFRSTDIAQVFLDADLRIRKFNPASMTMINFIETDMGRPVTHISNNIRSADLQADVLSVIRSGTPFEKEVQLMNGKNLLMRIMPYITYDGRKDGVIISFVDITAITGLNNIIRAVFNSSPSAIFALQAIRDSQATIVDFSVLSANYAANAMLNRDEDDLKGFSLKKDLPLLSYDGLPHKYIDVVNTGNTWHQSVFFEEEKKWFEVTVVKMMDGFVATFTNITERKQAEEKLRANYLELIDTRETLKKLNTELESKVLERTLALSNSEERFRLVSRATNDALWDWNFVDNIVWWGDSFYLQFGYDGKDMLSNRNAWAQKIHPEDRPAVEESIFKAINSSQTQWSFEYRFRKKDGNYACILDRGYILHNEHGTPYRMLGSMLDISELKTALLEIERTKEELELKVTERTQQLRDLNIVLEASNHDLQQFASIASHDLQEPLRKIHMFSQAIAEEYEEQLPEMVKIYFRKIIRSTNRMRTLVVDILNFSRLTADKSYFKRTDLRKMLEEIIEDFEFSIREKDARIITGPLPVLDVIPGQFRQVLHNLLSNALKFSQPGQQPLIRFEAVPIGERSFDSPAEENGPWCKLSVTDSGIGFEEKFAGTIFNLFQRLHSKDKFEGTGIGLAVAKKIIERHEGLISVHSEEGIGTRFDIIIPVHHP